MFVVDFHDVYAGLMVSPDTLFWADTASLDTIIFMHSLYLTHFKNDAVEDNVKTTVHCDTYQHSTKHPYDITYVKMQHTSQTARSHLMQ